MSDRRAEQLREAQRHLAAGEWVQAEAITRQVLADDPRCALALCILGKLAVIGKQPEISLDLLNQAAAIDPENSEIRFALGTTLTVLRRFDQAAVEFGQTVALQPDNLMALRNQAVALRAQGKLDESIAALERFIAQRSDVAEIQLIFAQTLQQAGQIERAVAAYEVAVILRPGDPELLNLQAIALSEAGRFEQAVAACNLAIAMRPAFPEAYINLGNAQHDRGYREAAVAAYRQAIALRPDYPEAHNNLGHTLSTIGQPDEAVDALRRAIALRANYGDAYTNLAGALADRGEAEQSTAAYRRAVELNPTSRGVHGNLLYSLYFHPDYDAHAILKEHRAWVDRHARALAGNIAPHGNKRDPERRLRIGYLSPDFCTHVVGWNLLPLLTHHDHTKFKVYCYSNVRRPDAFTDKLRASADVWRDIIALSDEVAAQLICDDRIDILVDLALYMAGSRPLIFARKPAPVQVTYLGYCGTTGLDTIDYRISDPYFDEPDGDCSCYSEQTWRLPRTYWSYQPGGPIPQVGPLPARSAALGGSGGHVTFGCLNTLRKVNDPVLQLWARVLGAVPGSRLLINAPVGRARQWITRTMAAGGIDASRLEFVGFQPWPAYIELYNRIDIALDPFPCNGGITTCDGLWMGVPVVTLRGQTAVGRAGSSILHNIGLVELIATSQEQYVRIATELADDLDRLAGVRSSLRDRLRSSPLMDAGQFARDVEGAYRQMWRSWCVQQGGAGPGVK
jgi:predicted O-linked N-acetylglucosamine transferase (SPINDLY family)